MKSFRLKMKQRFRIPSTMVERYKEEICFMVETNITCVEVVEPRVTFIEPMIYEMNEELIEGYAKIILEYEKDTEYPRWETYEEMMRGVHMGLYSKQDEKNVENKIQDIPKESSMTREEYNESLNIFEKTKSNGQTKLLVATPLIVVGPLEGITIVGPSTQVPSVPYVVVAQVQHVTMPPR